MASTFTPNIQLEEPARGDDVGTWDTPVNSNMTLVDKVVGAITSITLNNSPVVLAAAQFQSKTLTFVSTLTGSVAITFPASFTKSYEVFNTCTGSSAFVITLTTTAAGGQVICCPPGEIVDVVNDGTNLRYKNLARIGQYWDYGGSSVPAWVSGCTVQPYLNCDGTTFSSAVYPTLATIFGGNTLPDRRGMAGYTMNQGTGRLTAAAAGLDGNTLFANKTTQTVTIGTSNLPAYTPTGSVSTPTATFPGAFGLFNVVGGGTALVTGGGPTACTVSVPNFAGAAQGGVSNPLPSIGTGVVYGISMIRSA